MTGPFQELWPYNIILILHLIKANAIEMETGALSQVLSTDPILNELGQGRESDLVI